MMKAADITIMEGLCNLRCHYCGIPKCSWRVRAGTIVVITASDERTLNEQKLTWQLFDILDCLKHQGIEAIKLSGGEITVLHDLLANVVSYACRHFRLVQVLTNGIICATLEDLAKRHSNLSFQVSLDGIDYDANLARNITKPQVERIKRTIMSLAAISYLEINTVLTVQSVAGLPKLLEWVKSLCLPITVYPFPVRGRPEMFPKEKQLHITRDILRNYNTWMDILPSRNYVEQLHRFLGSSKRALPCRVPLVVCGVDEFGAQYPCPCSTQHSIGSIRQGLQKPMILGTCSRDCLRCYTHYDVLNVENGPAFHLSPFTRMLLNR